MAASPSYLRKLEVTRTVRFSAPDTLYRSGSPTPYQKLHFTWDGPVQELFGYTHEYIGDTESWWLERIHVDDLPRVLDSLKEHLLHAKNNPFAAEHRIWGADYRFRRADDEYMFLCDRCITTRDGQGNVVRLESVVFDREARKTEREDHAAFLAEQNFLAIVANNTPSGIFMMNPNGYPTYMNNAAVQITGFTLQEIRDYTFHAAVHSYRPNGDPYPLQDCPVFRHQQHGTSAKNESDIFIHKDGHFFDIAYSVSSVGGNYALGGSVIEFRDVTEEKRIERERMNAMLLNEQQSVRIKESEVHKSNMTSFVSFVCHELRNPLQGIMGSTEFLLDTLQKLEALSGKMSIHQDNSTAGSVHSLTAKNISIPLPNAIVRVDQPLTLKESGTAHADVGMATDMQSLIEEAKQLIKNIQICAEHQALITNNVLDITKLDAGKVEPTYDIMDVYKLGPQTVDMMRARAQNKNINLACAKLAANPLYLKADATILSQILLNLVSNAIKFTPDGGSITIDMYPGSTNSAGQTILHFSVTDTGLGMSDSEKERLFQRFSQANPRVAQLYGGSGLGLSISKELVKVLGGDMHVKSSPGQGSTFSFTSHHNPPTPEELAIFLEKLPLHSTTPGPEVIKKTSVRNEIEAPKFLLIGVAEDNPINAKYLVKHLKMLGYESVLCTNGSEMLDRFCEADNVIDAIIMDMSMPIMDGLEATRLMREFESKKRNRRTPIIALSGNALLEQITDAMDAGTSDYLIKPCKQADLARVLSYWEYIVHTGAPHKPMDTKAKALS